MDLTEPVLSHLGVFLLGVLTWLPFTLWEGKQIKSKELGETMPESKAAKKPQSFSRNQSLAALVVIVSLLLLGLGVQQTLFQKASEERATCYAKWGEEVTQTLDARSFAGTKLQNKERTRDDAVDDVLLVALGAFKDQPPLSDEERRRRFGEALTDFGIAKKELAAEYKSADMTKRENTYPALDCE
jgi:hypothetical protein